MGSSISSASIELTTQDGPSVPPGVAIAGTTLNANVIILAKKHVTISQPVVAEFSGREIHIIQRWQESFTTHQPPVNTNTMLKTLVITGLLLLWPENTLALSTSAPEPASSRLIFQNLKDTSFRHPLDRDLTSQLKATPFIGIAEDGFRRSFPVVEEAVRLDLLSTSVKVSENQLPNLHRLKEEACKILDFGTGDYQIPELYVQSNSQANAFTLALRGKDAPPIVVVTSALVEQCSEPEIQAIIGHELGHLKCEHSLYLTLGGLVSTPLRTLPFLGSNVDKVLQDWRLSAEYSCDRAAMLVAQDSKVVAGAMLKLISGTSKYNMSVEAFVAQSKEYDSLLKSANPLVRAQIQRQQRTHPLPVRRVAEIERWAFSGEYAKIRETGVALIGDRQDAKVEN